MISDALPAGTLDPDREGDVAERLGVFVPEEARRVLEPVVE